MCRTGFCLILRIIHDGFVKEIIRIGVLSQNILPLTNRIILSGVPVKPYQREIDQVNHWFCLGLTGTWKQSLEAHSEFCWPIATVHVSRPHSSQCCQEMGCDMRNALTQTPSTCHPNSPHHCLLPLRPTSPYFTHTIEDQHCLFLFMVQDCTAVTFWYLLLLLFLFFTLIFILCVFLFKIMHKLTKHAIIHAFFLGSWALMLLTPLAHLADELQ